MVKKIPKEVFEELETPKVIVEDAILVMAVPVEKPPMVVRAMDEATRVKAKITGKRFLAGTWYNLMQDKEMTVPSHVADCLRKSGAIYL